MYRITTNDLHYYVKPRRSLAAAFSVANRIMRWPEINRVTITKGARSWTLDNGETP